MTIISDQKVFCNTCGKEFKTNFHMYEGRVCSTECYQEYQWRKTLSVLGKPYMPYGGLDYLKGTEK